MVAGTSAGLRPDLMPVVLGMMMHARRGTSPEPGPGRSWGRPWPSRAQPSRARAAPRRSLPDGVLGSDPGGSTRT